MVNATGVLVLILILSFAADRIAKAIVIILAMVPAWVRIFPDPESFEDKAQKAAATHKRSIAYAAIAGVMAALLLWLYPEIRILRLLTGDRGQAFIDVIVSAIVIMGGSDLIGRMLRLSGINEAMSAAGSPGRATPVEVVGKLELENTTTANVPKT